MEQPDSRFNNRARQLIRAEAPPEGREPFPEPDGAIIPPSCDRSAPNRRHRQYHRIAQAETAITREPEPEIEEHEACRKVAKAYLHQKFGCGTFMLRSLLTDEIGCGSFGTVFSAGESNICYKCVNHPYTFTQEKLVAKHLLELPEWPVNIIRVWEPQLFEPVLEINGKSFIGYLPMERMVCDLNHIPDYDLLQANQVWHDIGAAICCLSDLGLAHCDVKSQNILCYNEGNRLRMKMGDIASITIKDKCRWWKVRGTTPCVSPSMLMNFHNRHRDERPDPIETVINALPPDLMPQDREFLHTEDVWQFAILLLEMLNPRFREENSQGSGWWRKCANAIEEGNPLDSALKLFLDQLENISHVRNLLYDMLLFYPDDRVTISLLKMHLRRMHIQND